MSEERMLFTADSLFVLLNKVEEFEGFDIACSDNENGSVTLKVNESTYNIEPSLLDMYIDVDKRDIEEIDHVGEMAIEEAGDVVTSGIIKEGVKTLLVGGVVRLLTKVLK